VGLASRLPAGALAPPLASPLALPPQGNQELQARIGAQTVNRTDVNRMHNERWGA
jgi:hypothetical protein